MHPSTHLFNHHPSIHASIMHPSIYSTINLYSTYRKLPTENKVPYTAIHLMHASIHTYAYPIQGPGGGPTPRATGWEAGFALNRLLVWHRTWLKSEMFWRHKHRHQLQVLSSLAHWYSKLQLCLKSCTYSHANYSEGMRVFTPSTTTS